MSEDQEAKPFGRDTCHICGSTDFIWGYVTDDAPDELSDEPQPKRARRCARCGNVHVFEASDPKHDA